MVDCWSGACRVGDQIAVLPALFHLPRHRVSAADPVAGLLPVGKRSGSA
jgi:hypothetical protein